MAITKAQRQKVEKKIFDMMSNIDKSGSNTEYYKNLFKNMSDSQFFNFFKKEFPIRYHYRPSITEPTLSDIKDGLKTINVPLTEKVNLNYLYKDENGNAVQSEPALVGYCPTKKMKQFITSKNKYGAKIENRDLKTGRLVGGDKGAGTSDREFESLATLGLTKTMEEFYGARADAMSAKNTMYNNIATTGSVSLKDINRDIDDSLSKNMFNAYLIGAHMNSNLINQDTYTLYTLRNKNKMTLER